MRVMVEIPDELLSALPIESTALAREVQLGALIHWFTQGWISQGKAAQVAGLCRADFMDLLSARKVALLNWDEEEFEREFAYVRSLGLQDRERLPDHFPEPSGVAGQP